MLRFMFRVVVVTSVVLSLTVLAVPSAQAGPHKANATVAKVDPGLLQAALSWLGNFVNGQKPAPQGPKSTTAKSKATGPCIDPLGRPRLCP